MQPQTKMILNASFGGHVLFKTINEAIIIIKPIASTNLQNQRGICQVQRRGVLELNSQDTLLAQQTPFSTNGSSQPTND